MSDPVAEHEEALEVSENAVVNGAEAGADGEVDEAEPQPLELPVLPLRGMVVYPQTAVPLTVGQPRSMKLVDDAVNSDRVICLVASLDPDNETPGPDEVCRVGTRASIHRLSRAPDGTLRLLVQGLTRLRIDEFVEHEPWLKASVSEIPEDTEAEELEIEALTRNVVDQFTRMAEMVPSIPGELISSALNMEDPLQPGLRHRHLRAHRAGRGAEFAGDRLAGEQAAPFDGAAGQGTGGAGAGPQNPDRSAVGYGKGAARVLPCANS